MIRIRSAVLQDYYQIWQVHASDIDAWVDAAGRFRPELWRRSSMAERWRCGGPWLSPETCAIHLNALLLAGQLPLVAMRGTRILAELELFIGEDARAGGKNANISVCYVERNHRGQGLGSALVAEAARRARVLGCQTLTVFNPTPAAMSFYQRHGLQEPLPQVKLQLHSASARPQSAWRLQPAAWPAHQQLAQLPLWIGYYQSSQQCWQQIVWDQEPGLFALPLRPIQPQMLLQGRGPGAATAYLALRPLGDGSTAQLYIWTSYPHWQWVAAAQAWAQQLGIACLDVMCDLASARQLQQRLGGQRHLGSLRLLRWL